MKIELKAEDINPFIKSVNELFENMLGCKIEMDQPGIAEADNSETYIIGVIGISGTAQGIVALTLPSETALAMIGRIVGAEFSEVDDSIIDGVGEMVNMIAGNAKSKFKGHTLNLSLPTVMRGTLYKVCNVQNSVFVALPFKSELGDFSLLVAIKPIVVSQKEAINAGTSG